MYFSYSREHAFKEVGETRQLFIDDDVIASVQNITRRPHSPRKHPANPLIRRDQPWEDTPYFRTSGFDVIRDPADGLFKCWYEDVQNYFAIRPGIGLTDARVCYAQSPDGMHWEKPRLGIRAIDGMDTNVVLDLSPRARARTQTVILDPAEDDPSRRFKMLHVQYERHDRPPAGLRADAHSFPAQNLYGVGLCMQVSEDGVRWRPHPANPIIPYWAGDVQILTYDPIDRKYVLYGRARKWTSPSRAGFAGGDMPMWPDKPAGVWNTRRCVYRLESDDCLSWSEPVMAFEAGAGDNLDDGLYGFVPWRVDEMHLGLLNVLHQVDNVMEGYLHYGRDGRRWHRLQEHRPLIPRGPEPYDPLGAETPSTPIEVGDEVWIYYGGKNVHNNWWISGRAAGLDHPEVRDRELSRDGHHLCLATLRLDGWVSLTAGVYTGIVETKPVFSMAPFLSINACCRPGGFVEVEVTDTAGQPFDGYDREACVRCTGDAVRHRVRWAGRDAVNVEPRGIKLRFHLRDADLFGFRFEPE